MMSTPTSKVPQLGSWATATLWLLVALACLVAISHGTRLWTAKPSVDIVVRMSVRTGGNGQFFPKTADGYSEATATTFALISDGKPHDYLVHLRNLAAPGAFRLDPGSGIGPVAIDTIELRSRQKSYLLQGVSLRAAITPLKHLTVETGASPRLLLRSQGDDPFLEVAMPRGIVDSDESQRNGGLLLALAGGAGLILLLWMARFRLRALASTATRRNCALAAAAALSGLVLLAALSVGCDGLCSPIGARYGAALMLAAVAVGVIGAALTQGLGLGVAHRRVRLFLWIGVGQLALTLYVFLRSAIHAFFPLVPLTGVELSAVVMAAAIYLWIRRPRTSLRLSTRQSSWLTIELALLAVVCLVVADRELPRLIMLSSDPDVHAYLARQLEVLGGIPWHGEIVFGYPAGTAALIFGWAKLSLLDVRNATAALPLLQGFFAAFMLGEALATRIRLVEARLLLMLAVMGVTAAGFLIPLYTNYSHMEGMGRQVAIGIAAVVPAILLAARGTPSKGDWRVAPLVLASLAVLSMINPISVVMPLILVIAYVLHALFAHRRISWWLVALAGFPVLLMLDPYFLQMASGSAPPSKIGVSDTLGTLTLPEVLSEWRDYHSTGPWHFLQLAKSMGPDQVAPMFALFLAVLLALRFGLHPRLPDRRAAMFAVALALAIFAVIAANGLFVALGSDRRFYLLAPYFLFTLGQLKILVITALVASVMAIGSTKGLRLPILAVAGVLLVSMVYAGMRSTRQYHLAPRADYCGSLGCVSDNDVAVIRAFERMLKDNPALRGTSPQPPRVLVPNSVHDTAKEDWVFPIAGARALPFYDVAPVAFFYYQGDDDFTTENYKTRVCREFDREWLRKQGVTHIFLPAMRGSACMAGMERLPITEQIVIQRGNSYLLRLH